MTVGQKSQHIAAALAKLPEGITGKDVLAWALRWLMDWDVDVCATIEIKFKFHRGELKDATQQFHEKHLEL